VSATVRLGPVSLPRTAVLLGGGLVAVEALALALYLGTADVEVLAWRYYLYPFVWVNVGVLAVLASSVSGGTGTGSDVGALARRLAALVACGYFLLLGFLDGSLALSGSATGFHLLWLPPGWGPAPVYDGAAVTVRLFPYRVVGYAALSYLVYAALVESSRAALSGLVGLVSCVSCTLPVAAALLSGLVGGTAGLAAATAWSYDLSTAVFVASVALLYWRPFTSASQSSAGGDSRRYS
jgi:hypothetical protein